MATAQETIITALRKLRVLPPGRSPSTHQAVNALADLNALYEELIGFGRSYPVQNLATSASVEIPSRIPAVRVQCLGGAALTITLPESVARHPVQDGTVVEVVDAARTAATYNITIARNGWQIDGAASNAVISTNGGSKKLFFRADLGDWKTIADLALTDTLPLPGQFDRGTALLLAKQLQGEYGQTLGRDDLGIANATRERIRALYVKPQSLRPDRGASAIGDMWDRARSRFAGSPDEVL